MMNCCRLGSIWVYQRTALVSSPGIGPCDSKLSLAYTQCVAFTIFPSQLEFVLSKWRGSKCIYEAWTDFVEWVNDYTMHFEWLNDALFVIFRVGGWVTHQNALFLLFWVGEWLSNVLLVSYVLRWCVTQQWIASFILGGLMNACQLSALSSLQNQGSVARFWHSSNCYLTILIIYIWRKSIRIFFDRKQYLVIFKLLRLHVIESKFVLHDLIYLSFHFKGRICGLYVKSTKCTIFWPIKKGKS